MLDWITAAVTALCLLTAVAAVLSGVYIWIVYRQMDSRKFSDEAIFLRRLVHRDLRVSIGSGIVAVYLVMALTGFSFGRPWGALIIGGVVAVLMFGPIGDALQWRRDRIAGRKAR